MLSIPCSPGPQCWNSPSNAGQSNTSVCAANADITQFIDAAKGGSLIISTISSGVTGVGTGCNRFNNSVVRMIYTLEGLNFPTASPTLSPNSATTSGAASVQALVTSGRFVSYLVQSYLSTFSNPIQSNQISITLISLFITVIKFLPCNIHQHAFLPDCGPSRCLRDRCCRCLPEEIA